VAEHNWSETVSSLDSWNSNLWFHTFLLLPIPAIADPILLVAVAMAIAALWGRRLIRGIRICGFTCFFSFQFKQLPIQFFSWLLQLQLPLFVVQIAVRTALALMRLARSQISLSQ
jgi:hypothetical protein